MRTLEQTGNRKKRPGVTLILGLAAVVLLFAFAVALAPLFAAADHLFQKVRYTSICTQCGEQKCTAFYLIAGSEISSTERVIPRAITLLNVGGASCPHETVLIGKSEFSILKTLELVHLTRGAPQGSDFQGEDLRKTLAKFSTMRSGAVLGHMETLNQKDNPPASQKTNSLSLAR